MAYYKDLQSVTYTTMAITAHNTASGKCLAQPCSFTGIRVSTSPIDYTCEDRNGYSGVSTQLGVISREPKEDVCKFLKQGRSGVTVYRWGKPIHNAVIPGAYANFPDK